MIRLQLAYDMWWPPFARAPLAAHYAAMLDQCAYADCHGFELVHFNEHHGTVENYLPSPLIAAAAVAARTSHIRTRTLLLTPFYDPIKLAEDIAVVDLIGGGRMIPVLAGGYRSEEFAMFGKTLDGRRRIVDATAEFLRRAWTGDCVEFAGRMVRVRPTPAQRPHPPIVMGGSSAAAARGAAQFADDFIPNESRWWEIYREARMTLGKPDPGDYGRARLAPFLHVSEDPERDWSLAAPYLLAAIGTYREWTTENASAVGSVASVQFSIANVDELRRSPQYRFVTPDQCVALLNGLGPDPLVVLKPGWGGYDPELAWSSLTLFVDKVLPRLVASEALIERTATCSDRLP